MTAQTVLICGSRGWDDFQTIRDRLAAFVEGHTTIFHGGAAGADRHVSAACVELGLDCYAFPPRYDEHGKAAPHVRNDQMLAQADRVIAFWDGKSRGTASVIAKARRRGRSPEAHLMARRIHIRDLFPWRLKRASTEQMDEIHRTVQRANLEDIRDRGLDVIASGDVTIEADTEAEDC